MAADLREHLSHVLWIGGGTDAGKSSVARVLAETHRLAVYHYDRADLRHHRRLAEASADYAAFLNSSLDERWVHSTPAALAERSWQAFCDRFPFVVEDLTALTLPDGMQVIAEGFGLTPELVAPVLTHSRQAVWLVPTESFKRASMEQRRKGEFGGGVSDPARAAENLLRRDRLIADRIRADAHARGMTIIEVDGSETVEALALRLADRFGLPPPG